MSFGIKEDDLYELQDVRYLYRNLIFYRTNITLQKSTRYNLSIQRIYFGVAKLVWVPARFLGETIYKLEIFKLLLQCQMRL